MAELQFIETPQFLGVEITEAEKEIVARELTNLATAMQTTKSVFELKLTELLTKLENRGMTEEQIINVLLDDFDNDGAIFGGLKRQLIGNAQEAAEETSSQLDAEIIYQESGQEPMRWIAVLVNTCRDCLPRHGITKSYDEWQALGLPRSGFSVCDKNCKCQLLPDSVAASYTELRKPLRHIKGKLTTVAQEKKEAGQIKNVRKYVNRKLGSINNPKEPLRKVRGLKGLYPKEPKA